MPRARRFQRHFAGVFLSQNDGSLNSETTIEASDYSFFLNVVSGAMIVRIESGDLFIIDRL